MKDYAEKLLSGEIPTKWLATTQLVNDTWELLEAVVILAREKIERLEKEVEHLNDELTAVLESME